MTKVNNITQHYLIDMTLDSNRCEGHDANWHWARRGETNVGEYEDTGLECCGDDAREHYAGTSNGKSCDTTEACCDNENDVASGGQCVESCPKAELTCDSQGITLSETPLTTGSTPTITVTVKNIGSLGTETAFTNSFDVIYKDTGANKWGHSESTPSLAAGTQRDITVGPVDDKTFDQQGDYRIEINLDTANTVDENNEYNTCTKDVTAHTSCTDAGGDGCINDPTNDCNGLGTEYMKTNGNAYCQEIDSGYSCCDCPEDKKFEYDEILNKCVYGPTRCDDGTYCSPSSNPWTENQENCLQYTPIPWEKACCFDATYEGKDYYSWKEIQVNTGAAQPN